MKNVIKFLVLSLVLLNINVAYSLERVEVKDNRTTMEYAPQSRDFINKVTNYKWEAENGEGFHFMEADKPYEDEFANQNMFLNVKTFIYGMKTGEGLSYVVQSKFVGFIDLINWESRTMLTLRLLPDGSLESYMSNGELMKFRKVQEWSENPDPVEDLESAEEMGVVF
jgi:hypothetical protein